MNDDRYAYDFDYIEVLNFGTCNDIDCLAWNFSMQANGTIPLKRFGNTDVQISALGLGGHHLGAAESEHTAIEIVHRALDGGITFFDCCWEYNRGKSED